MGYIVHRYDDDVSFTLVPQEYGFLPESSILRNLHKLLEGCHGDLTPAGMKLSCAILRTVSSVKGEVPPVDWSRLLVPCLRAALCSRDRDQLQREVISCLKRVFGFQQLMVYCVQPLIVGHLQVAQLLSCLLGTAPLAPISHCFNLPLLVMLVVGPGRVSYGSRTHW